MKNPNCIRVYVDSNTKTVNSSFEKFYKIIITNQSILFCRRRRLHDSD